MKQKKKRLFSTGNERRTVFIIGPCLFVICSWYLRPLLIYLHIWVLFRTWFDVGTTEMVHSGKDESEKGLLS
jgi:hypothetical protein